MVRNGGGGGGGAGLGVVEFGGIWVLRLGFANGAVLESGAEEVGDAVELGV